MEGPNGFPAMLREWGGDGRVKINHSINEISFVNGSKILLAHMQHEKDIDRIQGAEIHVAMIDELTQFTKSLYAFIRSRVRMTGIDVPGELKGRFPRILTASNPAGVGHNWVKSLFVDPVPPGEIWKSPPEEGGMTTQFIPARIQDNPTLLEEDPDYIGRLQGLNNPMLVKAMLEGDWNVTLGGIIDDLWRQDVHIIEPFSVPRSWYVDRAFDWGSSAPFATLWFAESNGETVKLSEGIERTWPRGTIFIIAEDYGWNGKPNEGLRLSNTEIAKRIMQTEQSALLSKLKVHSGPADTQIYEVESGHCIAADMEKGGVRWERADKGPGSRVTGWKKIRDMLKASLQSPMEEPGLLVFSTCRQTIRTLPVLPRDEKRNPDDVDTDAEDHIGDALRYRLLFRRRIAGVREVSGI